MVYTTAVTQDQNRASKAPIISPRELSVEELRFSTKIDRKFASTRELSGTKEFCRSGTSSGRLGAGAWGLR